MAIPHSAPGDLIDVRPFGASLGSTRTQALFKSEDLEVIRIVLAAGHELPAHAVPGDITLQCIEGSAEVSGGDGLRRLEAGHLIWLAGGELHGVRGVLDTSLLLTIALKKTAEAP
ncbi:MAG: cupin domain-containing protein [Ramlibacter sp.]|nr:cupin domain-containing protein [Ramlibacter sp.]